jgi:hypothetical protein
MKHSKSLSFSALATLALGAATVASCKAPVPIGELMLVLQTDMSLPKDVDSLKIEVLVRGDTRFSQSFEKLGNEESLKIPASLGVTIGDKTDPTTPITLRISAFQQGKARVLRETVTTVPADRLAAVRLPIQWLCWNQVKDDGMGHVDTSCPSGQTCVAGSCKEKTVDSSKLSDYKDSDVFGGGTGKGDGVCFDTATCFGAAADAPVDMATCSITASGDVNVAIRVDSAGICGPSGCFVTVDAKSDFGWQPGPNGTLVLPKAVCDRITTGLAAGVSVAPVSSACPLKTEGVPACGPWSSSGKSPGAPGTVTPVALIANQAHPVALALATPSVIWTNSGASAMATGSLKSISMAGGPTTPLLAMQAFPKDLALDESQGGTISGIYFTTNGVGGMPGAVVGLDVTDPMSPKPVSFAIPNLSTPEGIAVGNGALYFTDFTTGAIEKVDLATKMVTPIASTSIGNAQNSPYRIAVDKQTLFWTNEGQMGTLADSVMYADLADPMPTVLAMGQKTPRGLVLDLDTTGVAKAIYWTNSEPGGDVMTAKLSGTPAVPGMATVFASKQARPIGIAVDADTVYWTNRDDGTVMKAPKAGGAPVVVAKGQSTPGAIAVDADNVYWINEGSSTTSNGAVMKLAKTAPAP